MQELSHQAAPGEMKCPVSEEPSRSLPRPAPLPLPPTHAERRHVPSTAPDAPIPWERRQGQELVNLKGANQTGAYDKL